jgi:hypothetical protein
MLETDIHDNIYFRTEVAICVFLFLMGLFCIYMQG